MFHLSWLLVFVLVSKESVGENRKCIPSAAPKEWFPPLSNATGLVDYNVSSPAGWSSCAHFARATCCEKQHTDAVTRMLILMDRAGFSEACVRATEKSLCPLACDPDVGLGDLPAVLCLDTCSEWLNACKDEFFMPVTTGVQRMPLPCSDAAIVCSRLNDLYTTGSEFCDAMSIKWTTERCVTGLADPTRRGKIRPVTGSKSSSGVAFSAYESFLRDMRVIRDAASHLLGSYTKFVDRLLGKYGQYIAMSVPPMLFGVFLTLRGRENNNRARMVNNDDDFR